MSFLTSWYYFGFFNTKLMHILALLFCTLVMAGSSITAADDIDVSEARESAVQMARQGDYQAALTILEPLYVKAPDDVKLLYDYLVVLSWAEQDRKLVDLLPQVDTENAPLYVISAAAKSLRRLGYWASAEKMYRLGIWRFPDDIDMKAGLILTVTDAGRPAEALKIADDYVSSYPGRDEILLAQAYAAEATDETYKALQSYQDILKRDKFHREARHKQIMLLHKLGAYTRSLELAEQYPEMITSSEYRRLRGDKAAQEVRWSILPPVSEKMRFSECERVLEQIDNTLNSEECSGTEGKACQRQARLDRVVALKDCSRLEEVIEEYRNLLAEGEDLPGYVKEAVASTMLNMRKPEQALELYEEVIRKDPKAYQARIGLFFTLIEIENYPDAQELIDKIAAEQPAWIYPGGMKTPRARWRSLTTKIYAALFRFYSDDLAEAERRFTAMTNEAPANTDLLRELATIYLARGWPRRSVGVIELGQALEPKHRGLRIGHAEADMALRKYREAGEEITMLLEEFPEDHQVQRLGTEWRLHNMRELRLDTTISNSSGSVNGDREWEISTTVFSRPFHHQYRWFAGFSHAQAEFPEGSGELQRYSAGVEYASPRITASLATGFNDSESGRPGLWLDGTWYLDDYWSVPFSMEIYSNDTPLRAIRNGVRADAFSLGVTYRFHESRSVGFKGQIMDFSDSNFRTSLTLSGTQRLLNLPKQKLTAFSELSVSSNSRDGGPYFNPDSDLSISGGVEHLWRIYRRYDHSLHQRVRVSAGDYTQKGFGSDYTLGAEYANILELGNRYNMSYGVGLKRRVYDGDPEWNSYAFLSLNWRF